MDSTKPNDPLHAGKGILEHIVAVVLAGGLGTRLRDSVPGLPKALAPIDGRPFLEILLSRLAAAGFRHAVLCLGHLSGPILDRFGDGTGVGLRILYSVEDRPLGTAGALRHAANLIKNTFILMNGDTFLDLDFAALAAFHREHVKTDGAVGTVTALELPEARDSGIVVAGPDGLLRDFREKEEGGPGLVNAGVYAFETDVLHRIPPGRFCSLEREVIPGLIASGKRIYIFPASGDRFVDIGTPEGYARAKAIIGEG